MLCPSSKADDKQAVIYLKSPWTNIGNAFIDIGALYQLEQVLPDTEVRIAGAGLTSIIYNFYSLERARKIRRLVPSAGVRLFKKVFGARARKVRDKALLVKYSAPWAFEIIEFIEAKMVVIAGVALGEWFIRIYRDVLKKLANKGRKLLILGGGATSYTESEVELVRSFLKEVKPYAIITRDEWCYDNFSDLAEHSYNGIDCGFFVSSAWKPPRLTISGNYVVLTFDKTEEPNIATDRLVVRAHHSFWTKLDAEVILKKKENTFVSDSPFDYLTLYANAAAVYTDRVHAAVAAHSYGVPYALYTSSPRAKLFERLGVKTRGSLVVPNLERLEAEKQKQLSFLAEIIQRF